MPPGHVNVFNKTVPPGPVLFVLGVDHSCCCLAHKMKKAVIHSDDRLPVDRESLSFHCIPPSGLYPLKKILVRAGKGTRLFNLDDQSRPRPGKVVQSSSHGATDVNHLGLVLPGKDQIKFMVPGLQGFPLFLEIVVTVVNACRAAVLMVQDLVHHHSIETEL